MLTPGVNCFTNFSQGDSDFPQDYDDDFWNGRAPTSLHAHQYAVHEFPNKFFVYLLLINGNKYRMVVDQLALLRVYSTLMGCERSHKTLSSFFGTTKTPEEPQSWMQKVRDQWSFANCSSICPLLPRLDGGDIAWRIFPMLYCPSITRRQPLRSSAVQQTRSRSLFCSITAYLFRVSRSYYYIFRLPHLPEFHHESAKYTVVISSCVLWSTLRKYLHKV